MSERVFITGLACATAAGLDKDSFVESLFSRRFSLKSEYGTIEGCAVRNVGILDRETLHRESAGLGVDDYLSTVLIARLISQALLDAGLDLPRPRDEELRVLVGTNFGNPINYLDLYRFRNSAQKSFDAPSLDDIKGLRFREDRMSEGLQAAFGCGVRKIAIGMQCMSSIQSILMAAALVQNTDIERVIVGAYDLFDHFQYYMMRSAGLVDENLANPFGVAHAGCNYGDGAAFLVVESGASMARRGAARSYGEIIGGVGRCFPTDGKPFVSGIENTIRDALTRAELSPKAVDLICPHGCAIPEMDRAESLALTRVFGPGLSAVPVAVYSPFNGYSFSASGYLDIIALLGASSQRVAPGYAPTEPDTVSPFNFLTQAMAREEARIILKTKMGYSGAVGALLLRTGVN